MRKRVKHRERCTIVKSDSPSAKMLQILRFWTSPGFDQIFIYRIIYIYGIHNFLEYKETKIKKWVPFVLVYRLSLKEIAGIVRHHWKDVEKSGTLAKLFPEPPVVAFRPPKSIKDTLVRAVVYKPSLTVGQCNLCGDKRCKCSLQLQHSQTLHSKTTGKEYKIF